MTHLLGSGDDVSHSGFLATNVIVESLVFLELYSDDVRLCARRFRLSQLRFHLAEPVQQLVDVTDHLQRSLPKQQNTISHSFSGSDSVAFVKTLFQRNRLVYQVSLNKLNKRYNLREYRISQRFCFCQLNSFVNYTKLNNYFSARELPGQ